MLSAMPATTEVNVRASTRKLAWTIPILICCGAVESIAVYYSHAEPRVLIGFLIWVGSRIIYVAVTGILILLLSQAARPYVPAWGAWPVLLLCFITTLLVTHFAMEGFPNSGDEFGYNYLADTLLRGRVWNPSIPGPLHDLFQTYYIGDRDGKRASQYPPGWPALLALFKMLHAGQYANAIVGGAASMFIWFALRCIQAPSNVKLAAFILATTAPFVLFNNASYYNHTLTAVCISAIIWLDLRQRSLWNDVFIGVAFSILLTARYETFLIAGPLFGLDGLIRKRLGFIKPALAAAAGALPITALLLWYNAAITGHPFLTTLAWASPEITFGLHSVGVEGPHSLLRGLRHTVMWLLSWQDFASVLILPLYALALWRRLTTATIRWFDLLLPAIVVFFVFYPDYGGFQFGPRYWYLGYLALPVTIAAGLPASNGLWHVRRWRFDPVRLALLQLASFIGFTAAYAQFVHLRTEARELPFRVAMTAPPQSLVLMPETPLPFISWQFPDLSTIFQTRDFTRNGPDGLTGSILLGRAPQDPRQTTAICKAFPDRRVFTLSLSSPPPKGHLEPACNAVP